MSLIEVMMAILLLGVAIIPLFNLFEVSNTYTAVARHNVAALNFAQEIMEEVKGMPYGQIGVAKGGDNDQITLADETGSKNFKNYLIILTAGTGMGQVRKITEYATDIRVATIDPPWDTGKNPDDNSTYLIGKEDSIECGSWQIGQATGGGTSTIMLAGYENNSNNLYQGYKVKISGGKGQWQVRKVTDYNGSTKVATVEKNWDTTPDSTSFYQLYRYPYTIEVKSPVNNLKKITVSVSYKVKEGEKKVELTTEKLNR